MTDVEFWAGLIMVGAWLWVGALAFASWRDSRRGER